MSFVAMLIASALAAVGVPENYSQALGNRFPAWALTNNRNVYALLDIATRPDGTMMACRVVEWEGSKKFADQSCALVWHIILEPARAPDGTAKFGRRKLPLRFSTVGKERSDVLQKEQQPDYTVAISEVADAPEKSARIAVNVLVSPEGQIGACELASSDLSSNVRDLETRVCETLRTKKRFALKDDKKQPVSYVDSLLVSLVP